MNEFFELSSIYDVSPSFWKYYKTKNFHRLMNVHDQVTEISKQYIDKATKRFEKCSEIPNGSDKSILERLLKIDREIAIVMAIDMLLAGIDTVNIRIHLYYLIISF